MSGNPLKVLLIEDNPGDAFLIKFYLGESSSPAFETSHAETILQAYELLQNNTFDIILQDLNLPDSHGVDSIKKLLEKFPGNLVLVLTGLTDEEVGLETVRYGAQDFLVKGKFDGKVLVTSLLYAYERFKLNNKLSKFQEEIDVRKTRFDNLQRFLNIGVMEIHLHEDKVFLSTNAKKMLNILLPGNFFSKSEFVSFFKSFPDIFPGNVPENVHVESVSGVTATIEFRQFDEKVLGVIRLS